MRQTRRQSLVEAMLNILIGYIVAVGSQVVVFPYFGIETTIQDNALIGLWFTGISLIRSYAVRRFFA